MEVPTTENNSIKAANGIKLSSAYGKAALAMGFKENHGRRLFYGDGADINTHFAFRPGDGFYFDRGDLRLFFTEAMILRERKRILLHAKKEEYMDFFPYFAKLDGDADSTLLLALTVLCLREDSEIYRVLAAKVPNRTRRKKVADES